MDKSNTTLIESTQKSELGINPQIDGQIIRLIDLTEEEEKLIILKNMVKR